MCLWNKASHLLRLLVLAGRSASIWFFTEVLCSATILTRIINANSNYIASLQGKFPEIQSVTNLIGRDDYYFYPTADADKFRADDHRVMTTGIGYHAVEANQQIGGPVTYLDVTKTPLRDAQGKVFGVHLEFFALPQLSLQRVVSGGGGAFLAGRTKRLPCPRVRLRQRTVDELCRHARHFRRTVPGGGNPSGG